MNLFVNTGLTSDFNLNFGDFNLKFGGFLNHHLGFIWQNFGLDPSKTAPSAKLEVIYILGAGGHRVISSAFLTTSAFAYGFIGTK